MIREYLKEHILITDGAMGTYYDRKKSENGRIAEEANLLEPELITRIHEEYLEQGARLIRTNTFAANHAMTLGRGVRDRREQDAYVKHVIRAAWKLAQKAAENRPEEIFVAADRWRKICLVNMRQIRQRNIVFWQIVFWSAVHRFLTLRHFQILNMWQKQPDISKKNTRKRL